MKHPNFLKSLELMFFFGFIVFFGFLDVFLFFLVFSRFFVLRLQVDFRRPAPFSLSKELFSRPRSL